MDIHALHKGDFEKVIEHLKHETQGLRTGRATPALVEDVPVEAYGARQPLKAVASISTSDAKTLAVEPWDKSLMAAIEAAIRQSPIGINPVNDGKCIRLSLPDLTQERRAELIKVLHQKLEAARIALRKIREDVRGLIERAEREREIREDQKFKSYEDLDRMVKDYNEKIREAGEAKEKEINTV